MFLHEQVLLVFACTCNYYQNNRNLKKLITYIIGKYRGGKNFWITVKPGLKIKHGKPKHPSKDPIEKKIRKTRVYISYDVQPSADLTRFVTFVRDQLEQKRITLQWGDWDPHTSLANISAVKVTPKKLRADLRGDNGRIAHKKAEETVKNAEIVIKKLKDLASIWPKPRKTGKIDQQGFPEVKFQGDIKTKLDALRAPKNSQNIRINTLELLHWQRKKQEVWTI